MTAAQLAPHPEPSCPATLGNAPALTCVRTDRHGLHRAASGTEWADWSAHGLSTVLGVDQPEELTLDGGLTTDQEIRAEALRAAITITATLGDGHGQLPDLWELADMCAGYIRTGAVPEPDGPPDVRAAEDDEPEDDGEAW